MTGRVLAARPAGYEAETVAAADRDLKDVLGPLAYVVSGAHSLEGFDLHIMCLERLRLLRYTTQQGLKCTQALRHGEVHFPPSEVRSTECF